MGSGVQFFPQVIPPSTVLGRLSQGSGAVEAIPFGALSAGLGTFGVQSILLGTIAGTNTITGVSAAPSPAVSLLSNQAVYFIPAVTNTGTATLNRDALGAKNIFQSGAALVGGELQVGVPVLLFYDGTQYNVIGQLNFVQGGTGTVVRTLQGKARDTISVRDFAGVVGDGVNDDTAGFQAAINFAQLLGQEVVVPAATVRYLCSSGLTYNVTAGPLTIRGFGKYATVIRYGGTGTWLSATGGNISIQVCLHYFTLQLNGAAAVGVDLSQAVNSTVRSVRFASSTGSANGTGINARPTNATWAPFFNVIDDCTFDTLTSGIVMDTTVGNAPNRWRILVPTFLGGTSGIKIGNNSTNLVAGTDIIGPYFDQLSGAGITLGANADRTTIVAARQETAAGGSLFSINAAANRTTIAGYQVHAGTFGIGALGLRALMLGQWDDGLVRTGTGSGTPIATFLPGRTSPAYGPTITIDVSLGNEFDIVATNATAFTISSPINPFDGQRITIKVKNTSGGALGVITWGAAYKMLAFTSPTNTNNCAIDFAYDAASTNWYQVSPQSLQIPN
jgi:hypothetical protein